VPDRNDPGAALPADARARLDAFTAALERINVACIEFNLSDMPYSR